MNSKAGFMLSLAAKAGKVQSGEFATEKAIKENKAVVCLIAGDASDNTRKKFTDMCRYRQVPVFLYGDRTSLGHTIGREFRSTVAVTDASLGGQIVKLMSEEN